MIFFENNIVFHFFNETQQVMTTLIYIHDTTEVKAGGYKEMSSILADQ